MANLRSNRTPIKQKCTKAGSCCSQDLQHSDRFFIMVENLHSKNNQLILSLKLGHFLCAVYGMPHSFDLVNMSDKYGSSKDYLCLYWLAPVLPWDVKPLTFSIRIHHYTWPNMWLFLLTVLILLHSESAVCPQSPYCRWPLGPSGPPALGSSSLFQSGPDFCHFHCQKPPTYSPAAILYKTRSKPHLIPLLGKHKQFSQCKFVSS